MVVINKCLYPNDKWILVGWLFGYLFTSTETKNTNRTYIIMLDLKYFVIKSTHFNSSLANLDDYSEWRKFSRKIESVKFSSLTLTYGDFHAKRINSFILFSSYIIMILLYLPLIYVASNLSKLTIDNLNFNFVSLSVGIKKTVSNLCLFFSFCKLFIQTFEIKWEQQSALEYH